MARRVSDTFKAGMITDVIGAEGSVHELLDMYVRRAGELCARGPVLTATATAASAGFHCGWSQASFHPNIGTVACRGVASASGASRHVGSASRYQYLGAGLQSSTAATALSFNIFTEGTNKDQVILHAGVATAASAATGQSCERIVQIANAGAEVFMAGELGAIYKWGGSQAAAYKTGSVSIATSSAVSSRIITGSGTTWSGNVQSGQYILIDTIAEKANTHQRAFRITNVVSNTQLEIETPIYASAASAATGLAYRIQSIAILQSPDGVWNGTDERPRQVGVVAYHGSRVWTAGVSDNDTAYNTVYNYDRVRWSGTQNEASGFFAHGDLWHDSGSIDVFPGIGGSIRGLVSMGSELVVVKSHGLFRIVGSFNYDGTGDGINLQVISTEVGAKGFNAFANTRKGLVVASNDGIYIYNGDSVSSLTDGRIKRWWEANYSRSELAVTQYEDKLIITPVNFTGTLTSRLVWDIEQDIFWTMEAEGYEYLSGVSTYTVGDEWVGDYSFSAGTPWSSAQADNTIAYDDVSNINHKKGFSNGYGSNDTQSGLPKPALITQPFPLGEDVVSEGRVNYALINAAILGDASATIDVTILSGLSYAGISNVDSAPEVYATSYGPVEYPLMSTASAERVFRVNSDSFTPSVAARLRIEANAADNQAGLQLRIYGIGIEFEPADVRGPTS